MKKIFLFLFSAVLWSSLFISEVKAQVITNSGSGLAATYTSLANAITALNAATITQPVVITLTGNETAPAGGYAITQTGGTSVNTIIIQGSGSTITAYSPQATGSLNDAVFKLIGADWITITGFTMQENPGNTVNTPAASNTMTEFGVAMFYTTATDGSQHNTIQNNTISLNRTYLNTFGIYSNASTTATSMTTLANASAASGSNSFNKVYSNTISNVNYGIVFIGSSTIGALDNGNDIGGNSAATGNTLTNCGGGAALSGYNYLTGLNYLIFDNHQYNDNISFNNITSASGLTTGTVTHGGIFKNYSATAPAGQPTGTVTTTINNNTITLSNSPTTGAMLGINNTGLTALATATMNINNNTILNCSLGTGATSAAMTAIANTSVPGVLNINNNIIQGNTTSATTGGFTGISNSGAIVTTCNINNNQLGNNSGGAITLNNPTTNIVYGIYNTGGAATCAHSINNNNFQGFTYNSAGTGAFRSITQTAKVLTSTVNNNNFNNLTINTSGQLNGCLMYLASTTPTVTVSGNYITTQFKDSNPTGTSGPTYAVYNNGSPTSGTSTISGNTFSNIIFKNSVTTAGSFAVIGWLAGGTGSTSTHNIIVTGNTIHDVSNTSTGTISQVNNVYGIYMAYGFTNTISNNIVYSLTTAGGTPIGIYTNNVSPNPAGTTTIKNNLIHDIKSTSVYNTSGFSVGDARGIQVQSGPAGNTVYDNKIYNVSCETPGPGQGGSAIGMIISQGNDGSVTTVYNNYIGKLYSVNSINPQAVVGIWYWGSSANTTNIYYNTVYLDGNVPGCSGCYMANSVTSSVDLRNNIFVNNCVPTGGLEQMIYFFPSLTDTYLSTSNNNILYSGTPGPLHIIYADGMTGALTNIQQSLSDFQTFAGPLRESNSKTENAPFANTITGSGSDYLHIDLNATTLAESGAVAISGITDDYDGNVRQGNPGYPGNGTAPDIGADEFTHNKTLNLTVFLQGLYAGGGNMNQAHDESGPHFATGVADQITVELHNASTYATIEYTSANVNLGTNGQVTLTTPGIKGGSYYITVKHRNSIQTVTAIPVSLASGANTYDFTDNSSKAYGNNLMLMADGKYVIYGGDVNQDDIVDGSDMAPVDNLASAFAAGYLPEDCNSDGLIDGSDMSAVDNNASAFIGASLP